VFRWNTTLLLGGLFHRRPDVLIQVNCVGCTDWNLGFDAKM